VTGRPLAHENWGDGVGPPVVLLHSLGADRTMWEPCRAGLARHRLIAVDSAGHGRSVGLASGAIDLDRWMTDLDILLSDDPSATPVVLVGVSMGGIQALAYAARRPDRVAAVVVADSFAVLPRAVAESKIADQRRLVTKTTMALVAEAYVAATFADPTSAGAGLVRRSMSAMDPFDFLASVRATFDVDIVASLPQVQAPTLVLWGDRDTKTPRELSQFIADCVPDARLQGIPDAGHLSNLDNPEAFARAVDDFLVATGATTDRKRPAHG
jgi:3-oxoadipate enol-lactonase